MKTLSKPFLSMALLALFCSVTLLPLKAQVQRSSVIGDGCPECRDMMGFPVIPPSVLGNAPLVYLHSAEAYFPTSAEEYISHTSLRWAHSRPCPDHLLTNTVSSVRLGDLAIDGIDIYAPYKHHMNTLNDVPIPLPTSDLIKCGDEGREFKTKDHTRPFDSNRCDGCLLDDPAFNAEGFCLRLNGSRYRAGTLSTSPDPLVYAGAPVYYDYVAQNHITYWFFYAYDDFKIDFPVTDFGFETSVQSHEGDWEHVSIELNCDNNPVRIAYYQHDKPPFIAWLGSSDVTFALGHPAVYSAQGSHASYPKSEHNDAAGGPWDDRTNSGYEWHTWNNLRDVHDELWYGYGGGWGLARGGGSSSGPSGPSRYKGSYPKEWDTDELHNCNIF